MISPKNGQIALSFVLLVSGIIVEIVIAGSFVTYFLSNTGLGERLQSRATTAAYSGIWDAMVKISKNRDFSASPNPYSLVIGNDSAVVGVSRTTDNPSNSYVYTVSSLGVAAGREKNLVATALVNLATGQVQLKSLADQPVQ
ncbi:MAG: hypothetical protein ABSE68_03260 [Minisyncoccia bacterium]